MRKVPYLNGVRAFEASARRGSFAAAAKELNVTPAAISRMVRLLEQRLGLGLFVRAPNRLALTPVGRSYQAGLTPILDALANLTDQVRTLGPNPVLTVGVGPTFAIRWLIPRLAEFAKLAPEVDVRITTGGVAAPFSDDWTCGIKLGSGDWPGLQAQALFAADLTPVCAPRVAARLNSPASLRNETLLRVAHATEDWPRWLAAAGVPRLAAKGPVFEYYGHALQAAADGVGIAIGIRPYIDDDLAAGRLVAPFGLSVPKGEQWYLVFREFRREEPAFRAFSQWITKAAQR
ncbi:MAG TPA: LysR substrate-binding domain-containing protein [Xanthobacteraceae bacterium]|nr:LysR substrate-binding domain-containing protein [Xanthobacteraceae bacterium]